MSTRQAMKITLKHLFELLADEKGISFTDEQVENAIEIMHDDWTFKESLLDFMEEEIETMGENYGLY